MKRIILIVAFLFLFASCATHPPSKIENDVYTNPKYAFSIKIPVGWKVTEKAPSWYSRPYQSGGGLAVMFINTATNGFISIESFKNSVSPSYIDEVDRRIKVRDMLAEQKVSISKKPECEDYSYTIGKLNVFFYDHPQLVATEQFIGNFDFIKMKHTTQHYLYLCHKDDTCTVSIVLSSNLQTHEDNYRAYEMVVDSLIASGRYKVRR